MMKIGLTCVSSIGGEEEDHDLVKKERREATREIEKKSAETIHEEEK
jgi:hypothetical protein